MKFFKKSDAILIVVMLAIGLGSYLIYNHYYGNVAAKAEIYYYSELVETIDLEKGHPVTFSIPEEPDVVFQIDENGEISFIESDCPDKVCIRSGKLKTVGQYAACLPNGVVLKIIPGGKRSDDDLDIVVGK